MTRLPLYLFDTSAILALIRRENGWESMRRMIEEAERGAAEATFSFISVMECFYRIWQFAGEAEAVQRILEIRNLPIEEIGFTDAILFTAGRLKAQYRLSLAGAWIAGTAIVIGATLVHKDPEFDALAGELAMQRLPAA